MKTCKKIPFNTEAEARYELIRILGTQHKPWLKSSRKPSRLYLCDCGKYHLTSSIDITEYY